MVRNECLRFGGHVGKQVSYKISRLEILKHSVFSHLTLFSTFEAVLTNKNTSRLVGVKWWHTYKKQWKWYNLGTLLPSYVNHTISLGNTILLKSKVVFVNGRMSSFKSGTKIQSGIYMSNLIGWTLHKESSIRGIEQ
jgi:hypothetical protein